MGNLFLLCNVRVVIFCGSWLLLDGIMRVFTYFCLLDLNLYTHNDLLTDEGFLNMFLLFFIEIVIKSMENLLSYQQLVRCLIFI
jgi:hypothetical protein